MPGEVNPHEALAALVQKEVDDVFDLIDWLSKEDYSQYGECHGKSLDVLVSLGWARLHGDNGYLGGFIAKGKGPMFQSVSLTDEGRAALIVLREDRKARGV